MIIRRKVTKTSPVSGAWNLTNSNKPKLSIGAPEAIYSQTSCNLQIEKFRLESVHVIVRHK